MRNVILLLAVIISPFVKGQNPDFLKQKADSLYNSGEYSICTSLYRKADSLYTSSDIKNILHCRSRLADCQVKQGKLEESERTATKALKFCSRDFINERSNLLNTLGMIQLAKGRQDLAEEYFNQSLNQLPATEKSVAKAECYNNIGILNWLQGNQQIAVEHMYHALNIRKELLGDMHTSVAASYNDLGLIYSYENPQKAIEYYMQALEIYKKVYPINHPSLAVAFNNIGIIERKQGDIQASLSSFEKSLQIRTSLYGTNHPTVAFVYTNMGESYFANGETTTALEYHQKALSIYKKNHGEKHPEIASTYNSIGSIHLETKNHNEALGNFQNAICANMHNFNNNDFYENPSIKNYYNPDVLLESLLLKSRALESLHYSKTLKLKDLETSLETLTSCDTLIGILRQIRTGSKDKIELGKLSAEIYEDAISTSIALSQVTLKKKYYLEKAFYYSEKNKGAVLLESIADANAKSFAGIPDSILRKEKDLKNEISFIDQKIAQGPTAEEEKAYRSQLFSLNRTYEQLIEDLEKKFPDYYNLKYNTKTLSIKDIQNAIHTNDCILSYFIAENKKRIYVFLISKNTFKILDLPLKDDFNKKITALRNSIKLKVTETYTQSAHNLYTDLFPQAIPSKVKHLIIIPDGKLGSIPFETLLYKKEEKSSDFKSMSYLINKYAFSYNYSCALFVESRNKQNAFKQEQSILLTAPVTFDESKNLNSLPGSLSEVEKINSLFTTSNKTSKLLLKEEANEKNIKSSELKNYTFLHFATHGVVNEDKPELSQIFLSSSPGQKEDGNLFSGEIYNLEIKANLTVLSACQTGLGKLKKGEGIIGLSRALIYAGSNNVMVSLWTVSDESTSSLMIDFYEQLIKNSKSTVTLSNDQYSAYLQKAKIKLIREGKFSQPYYWAPFIFIGN